MELIRYIHAADLHLDTPFRGLARDFADNGHLSKMLRDATFTALDRLVRLCETEKPDFVVIVGDIYNQEEHSIQAQLKLRDACLKLKESGIQIYIAHGNHDPLSSKLTAIEWPDNVTIFDAGKPTSFIFEKDGQPMAIVHGISHARDKESGNLAAMFQRDATYDCFQLGVLHCSVKSCPQADNYAPCSLDDLRKSGLDAWALGHIHEHCILCENPFIAYSGNTQGLHINETGPRGCLLVSAQPVGGSWRCQCEFHQLGPVQWEKTIINIDQCEKINDLDEKLSSELENLGASVVATVLGLIVRPRIEGRTMLDAILRQPGALEDLASHLLHFATGKPSIWIKDFELATNPYINVDEYLNREDLLGETIRICQTLLDSPGELEEIKEQALSPLFGNPRYRKGVIDWREDQTRELLIQAQRICQDILEGR